MAIQCRWLRELFEIDLADEVIHATLLAEDDLNRAPRNEDKMKY